MPHRSLFATALLAAVAAPIALSACGGGSATSARRAVLGFEAPPLIDVKWVPPFPLGEEPSLFNEGMLLGKVVLLDFYASW